MGTLKEKASAVKLTPFACDQSLELQSESGLHAAGVGAVREGL